MGVYFQVEEYHRPQDLAKAVDLLSRFENSARVIAGGTDILPLRPGVKKIDSIQHLVDISRLDLDYLIKEGDHIRIGAATTINAIGASPLFLSGPYRALSDAGGAHSTTTIRNRATVGGNLCNASPCADVALPLLVLDAILVVTGLKEKRHVPIESFFKGANYAALNKEEVLVEIRIPLSSEKTGTSFLKLRRHQTAIDMAVVNVATALTCKKNIARRPESLWDPSGQFPFVLKRQNPCLPGQYSTRKSFKRQPPQQPRKPGRLMMSAQHPPTARKWLQYWPEDPLKTVCAGAVNEKARH